jgi:RNAse (barnase) inhibitor barstar
MKNKTDEYIIDFKNIKNRYDLFEVISTAMNFPDYFGNNWDAFWDCITDMANLRIKIHILNFDVLKKVSEKDSAIFVELLRDFKDYYDGKWADLKEITIRDDGDTIHI